MDHILFICSGAFHQAKPSDLMRGRVAGEPCAVASALAWSRRPFQTDVDER
jgi:hypothetical protein